MKLTCSIDEIRRLGPEEVKEIMDNDMSSEFQLLDVRQPYEFSTGTTMLSKEFQKSETTSMPYSSR
jgi:hypothetical protein